MLRKPEISVCIPVLNGERFLAETLRSVLAQTFEDFELVVVDNASTDRTPEILREFSDPRLRVVRNESVLSLADNWNKAVVESRAPLVKLVCGDDLLAPRCLELQREVLRAGQDLALVCARRDLINGASEPIVRNRGLRGLLGRLATPQVVRKVVRHGGNPLGEPGGALFRREHFDAVGGFDPQWHFTMDLALWIRLLEHGAFFGMRESLAAFRIRTDSLSAAQAGQAEYAEQRSFTERLSAEFEWHLSRRDRLVSAANAPGARLRREALFLLVAMHAQRLGSETDQRREGVKTPPGPGR